VVEFTTITDNDAGTYDGGLAAAGGSNPTMINGAIIAGNSAATNPDLRAFGTHTIDANFMLLGTSPGGTVDTDATTDDLLGADPQLAPLADNGGPTETHLLGAVSPVINVVSPGTIGCGAPVDTDQRGEPRPAGNACDLGAVENTALPAPPAIPTLDRTGLLLLIGALGAAGLLGYRRRAGAPG